MFRGKPASAASLLILVLNVFRGHALTCDQSEYEIDNRCCLKCPPGYRVYGDCHHFSGTLCVPCPEGRFMDQPTQRTQCYKCTSCHAGAGLRIKTSCTKKSDTVCETLEGFYCTVSAEGGCAAAQRHKSCRPGQHISQSGTSQRDAECSACSDGTFSDGTFTSCQTHTQCGKYQQLLIAGTDSTDAQCEEPSGNTAVSVGVGVVAVLLFLAAAVLVFYHREKIKRLFTGKIFSVSITT
uniref:tumor necrosis factor receptor superfamily member 14-like n=1 Tax=Semicossyphus pulcher TaxID=241346 RepID=UPI0037E823F3